VVDFIIKTCYVVLQELTSIYEEKKHAYDTASAGMESNMAKLEQVTYHKSGNFGVGIIWHF